MTAWRIFEFSKASLNLISFWWQKKLALIFILTLLFRKYHLFHLHGSLVSTFLAFKSKELYEGIEPLRRKRGKTFFCNSKILISPALLHSVTGDCRGGKAPSEFLAFPAALAHPPSDKAGTLASAPSPSRRRSPCAVGIISLLLNHL